MKYGLAAIAYLALATLTVPASAAARCPGYVLKSSIKELCWEGAWRPYERDNYRDNKGQKYKFKNNTGKPKWRLKSGQGGNMKNK
jgi:hypothetical protein